MSATSTIVVMPCDICQENMQETRTGMVCWPCRNFIPLDELWRYEGARIVRTETGGEATHGN